MPPIASMSGQTSQPNLNSIVAALAHTGATPRSISTPSIAAPITGKSSAITTRPFDTVPKSGTAEVYIHEMPGGQYTNLKEQAEAMG
jgi:pyruvate carboxylase